MYDKESLNLYFTEKKRIAVKETFLKLETESQEAMWPCGWGTRLEIQRTSVQVPLWPKLPGVALQQTRVQLVSHTCK